MQGVIFVIMSTLLAPLNTYNSEPKQNVVYVYKETHVAIYVAVGETP